MSEESVVFVALQSETAVDFAQRYPLFLYVSARNL